MICQHCKEIIEHPSHDQIGMEACDVRCFEAARRIFYDEADRENDRANRAMDNAARLRDKGQKATYCHSGF